MSDPDDDDPASGTYNNTHRAFLQALLAKQTITYEAAKPLLSAILTAASPDRPTLPGDITNDDFNDFIDKLHDAISPFDFEIRSMESQTTKERIYALVNGSSDNVTVLASVRGPDEMGFVKRVLDRIFEGGNTLERELYAIKGIEALKLRVAPMDEEGRGGAVRTLTNSEAERVLDCLVREGWLVKSRKGWLSPTERLLMELNRWLRDVYNNEEAEDEEEEEEEEERRVNIRDCAACRTIITIGRRCPNLPCEVRFHEHCLERNFHGSRERECPSCKTNFSNPLLVGETAARGYNEGPGRTSTTSGSARASGVNGHVEDDSDADGGAE